MHASSYESMQKCIEKYFDRSAYTGGPVTVVDLGAGDVNGSYSPLFAAQDVTYVGVDLEAGPGVDIVAKDAYALPLPTAYAEVVLSGQALEHSEFFWLAFSEMVRILKPDGFLFLIVPSAGPIHRFPVDCYRFYPDALAALARYAGCYLIDSWHDDRGPWNDLVGVFAKQPFDKRLEPLAAPSIPKPLVDQAPSSDLDEERTSGVVPYLDVLQQLHEILHPDLYVEIGVRYGDSLALAKGRTVAVDPWPTLKRPYADNVTVHARTSDWFFELDADTVLDQGSDLALIDGMHLFEHVLRDFMNVEKYSHPGTVAVIDDIFPCHRTQASRTRRTRVWTGDVWKIIPCLQEYRPDLLVWPIDTSPTGLSIILGLDASNRVLRNQYNSILRRFVEMSTDPPAEVLARRGARDKLSTSDVDLLCEFADQKRCGLSTRIVRKLIDSWRASRNAAGVD